MSDSESEEEYHIEKILQERTLRGKTQYLIKWEGYNKDEDNTWEPAREIHKTEAFKKWQPQAAPSAASAAPPVAWSSSSSSSKNKKKPESDDEAEVSGSDSDEGSDGGDWKPRKGKAAPQAKTAAARTPATAATSKQQAKRPLEVEDDDAPLTAESMLAQLAGWDAPALKSFISAISKEANKGPGQAFFANLKAPAKKGECLEDARVCIHSAYAGLGTTPYAYISQDPRFQSERVRSRELPSYMSATKGQQAVEAAFKRCRGGVQSKRLKASMCPEAKALLPKLEVLDKAQLATLVCTLVDAGHVAPQSVIDAMPSADLEPLLKELEKLVSAISRALPNSRYGSCTDHFGYKRCASACNTAKRKFLEGVKQYKSSKQWGAAKEFADRALPIARQMVVFDHDGNNGARSAVLTALTALQAEAQGNMCVD